MCPRGRPRGQGRPRGLHLCYLDQKVELFFPGKMTEFQRRLFFGDLLILTEKPPQSDFDGKPPFSVDSNFQKSPPIANSWLRTLLIINHFPPIFFHEPP